MKFHACVHRNTNKCLHENIINININILNIELDKMSALNECIEFHCGLNFTSVMRTGVRLLDAVIMSHFYM